MTSAENSISQPPDPPTTLAIIPPVTKNLATTLLRELHIIKEAVSNTRHSVLSDCQTATCICSIWSPRYQIKPTRQQRNRHQQIYSRNSRTRPPKMQRRRSRLREVVAYKNQNHRAPLPRRGPDPSTLWKIVYCMQCLSHDMCSSIMSREVFVYSK